MKSYRWLIGVVVALLAVSAATYLIHYLVFHDAHHIFVFLVEDLAFIPIEVLLVALVIERLLARREKAHMLQKLNMVIGTFFSEMGTRLLGTLTACIVNREELRGALGVTSDWSPADFKKALAAAGRAEPEVDLDRLDLAALKGVLAARRDLLVTLLGNPNLLEHERFTELLWAVFHLLEELTARESLEGLPETDREHIAGDVRRVYSHLTVEWLHYCEHLQRAYPYIFSIVSRTHPLQETPDPVVRS
jgi:branched-subunit amino acid transport protein